METICFQKNPRPPSPIIRGESLMNSEHADWMADITETGKFDDDVEKFMMDAIEKFKSTQTF